MAHWKPITGGKAVVRILPYRVQLEPMTRAPKFDVWDDDAVEMPATSAHVQYDIRYLQKHTPTSTFAIRSGVVHIAGFGGVTCSRCAEYHVAVSFHPSRYSAYTRDVELCDKCAEKFHRDWDNYWARNIVKP